MFFWFLSFLLTQSPKANNVSKDLYRSLLEGFSYKSYIGLARMLLGNIYDSISIANPNKSLDKEFYIISNALLYLAINTKKVIIEN